MLGLTVLWYTLLNNKNMAMQCGVLTTLTSINFLTNAVIPRLIYTIQENNQQPCQVSSVWNYRSGDSDTDPTKPHYWKYVASGEMILLYWTETGDCKMTSELARWKSIWQKILHFTQVLKNQPITAKFSPKSFSKLSDLKWFIFFKFFVLSHDYFVKTVMRCAQVYYSCETDEYGTPSL